MAQLTNPILLAPKSVQIQQEIKPDPRHVMVASTQKPGSLLYKDEFESSINLSAIVLQNSKNGCDGVKSLGCLVMRVSTFSF